MDCKLLETEDGQLYCPVCDPRKLRTIDGKYKGIRRECQKRPPPKEPASPKRAAPERPGMKAAPVASRGCGTCKKMPGMAQLAKNIGTAAVNFAKSGFKIADDKLFEARLTVCNTCPHRVEGRCSLCGCFIVPKAKLLSEKCPDGRWPGETQGGTGDSLAGPSGTGTLPTDGGPES